MIAPVPADDDPRCYLHVGTHKTATTAIQRFCAVNTAALAARGTCYPLAGRLGESYPGHHNAARELFGHPSFDPALGTFEQVVAEIAGSRAPRACVSSEEFEYLYDRPEALERMRDALVSIGYRPVVVIYLRAQGDYVESLYAEAVKAGFTLGFDAFVRDIVREGVLRFGNGWTIPFEYSRMIDGFAGAFGDDVIVRPYTRGSDAHSVIRDFVSIVDPAARSALSFAEAGFEHVRPSTGEVIGWLFDNTARVLKSPDVRSVAEPYEGAPASERPFRVLTAQQRGALAARFAADNRALAARFGFDASALSDRGSGETERERDLFAAAETARRAVVLAATATPRG